MKILLLCVMFILSLNSSENENLSITTQTQISYENDEKIVKGLYNENDYVIILKATKKIDKVDNKIKATINYLSAEFNNKEIDISSLKYKSVLLLNDKEIVKQYIKLKIKGKDKLSNAQFVSSIKKLSKDDKNLLSFQDIKNKLTDDDMDTPIASDNPNQNNSDEPSNNFDNPNNQNVNNHDNLGSNPNANNPFVEPDTEEPIPDKDKPQKNIKCDNIISKDKKSIQKMENQDNTCVKVGTPIAIISTFEGCKEQIDYLSKTVTFYKRKIALGEKNIVIENCKQESKLKLHTTYIDATVKHDFIKKESIQFQKFYYLKDNVQTFVGEDLPTDIKYDHKIVSEGCPTRKVTGENGVMDIILSKKIVYYDSNNLIKVIAPCSAYGSDKGRITVQREICRDPKSKKPIYSHNVLAQTNGNSRPKIKTFYLHPDTKRKIYLSNSCTAEDLTFEHKTDYCPRVENDTTKKTEISVKTYFVDTVYAKEKIYITGGEKECKRLPIYDIPYIQTKFQNQVTFVRDLGYQRLKKLNSTTFSLYSNSSKVIDLSSNVPLKKSGNYNITKTTLHCYPGIVKVSYLSCNNGWISSKNSYKSCSHDSESRGMFETYHKYTEKFCNSYEYLEYIGEYEYAVEFLRGDGTIYTVENKKVLRITK